MTSIHINRGATMKRHIQRADWAIEGWLLAWTETAEPSHDYTARLLAEDDDGNWLVPAEPRDGEPWWAGRWRWYKPSHWPPYFRSVRRRAYVMVEQVPA